MRKLSAFLLLSAFVCAQLFHFFYFRGVLDEHRKSVKQSLNHLTCSTMKLSFDEVKSLKWKKADEFWFHGNLYDLKSFKVHNGYFEFFAKNDSKEEQLLADYAKSESGKHCGKTNSGKIVKVDKDKSCSVFECFFPSGISETFAIENDRIHSQYSFSFLIPPRA